MDTPNCPHAHVANAKKRCPCALVAAAIDLAGTPYEADSRVPLSWCDGCQQADKPGTRVHRFINNLLAKVGYGSRAAWSPTQKPQVERALVKLKARIGDKAGEVLVHARGRGMPEDQALAAADQYFPECVGLKDRIFEAPLKHNAGRPCGNCGEKTATVEQERENAL